jgi:hypothetical protein
MLSAPNICDTVHCERCSWWFISEYVFFWSMYLLVYWRVPMKLKWSDRVEYNSVSTGTSEESDHIKQHPTELDF